MAMFERSKVIRDPLALILDISPSQMGYVGKDVFIGHPAPSVVEGCVTCESFFANNSKAGEVYKSAIHELHVRCEWPLTGSVLSVCGDVKRLLQTIERESEERATCHGDLAKFGRAEVIEADGNNQPSAVVERARQQDSNLANLGDGKGAEEVRKSPIPILVEGEEQERVQSSKTAEKKNEALPYGFNKYPTKVLSPSEEVVSPTSDCFGDDLFRPGRAITKKVQHESSSRPTRLDISAKSELTAIGTERQRGKGYPKFPSRLQYPSGHKTPLSSPVPPGLPSPLTPTRLSPAHLPFPLESVPLGSPIGDPTLLEWKPLVTATRGEDITRDPFLGITITPPPTIRSEDTLWPTLSNKRVQFSTPGPKRYPFSRMPYPFGNFGFHSNDHQPAAPVNDHLSPDYFKMVESVLIPSPDGLPRQ